jgi:hypothetical protein
MAPGKGKGRVKIFLVELSDRYLTQNKEVILYNNIGQRKYVKYVVMLESGRIQGTQLAM